MLRIRFVSTAALGLSYAVERMGDGKFFDFSDSTFKASPTTLRATLPESAQAGRYAVDLATPTGQWTDGDYTAYVWLGANSATIGALWALLINGDDATPTITAGTDPWTATNLAAYAPGTAGKLVATNLDAQVTSRAAPGAAMTLDLSQSLANRKDATVGGALLGAFASTFGRRVRDLANKLVKLFGPFSNVTPLATYALDDNAKPTTVTPQ